MKLLYPRALNLLHRARLLGISLLMLLLLSGCDSVQVEAPELTSPLLQTPRDEQAVHVGSTITFTWQAVDGAHHYECEVRISDDEGNHVMSELTDELSTTLTFDVPGQYSWRVRAQNEDGGNGYWSEARELSIQVQSDP